jgi:thiol-disulfide isomerase/thioredoxin
MSNRPGRAIKRKQARARPAPQSSRSLPVVWLAIGGLAAVVAIALVTALAVGGDDSPAGEQTGFAEIIGSPLPAFNGEPPAVDPAVGLPAPVIVASEFTGEPVRVEPGGGSPKILIFFAHWCSHCRAELPRLVDWLDEDPVTDFEIIGISTAVDPGSPNYPPSAWFEDEEWTLPVLRDNADSVLDDGFGGGGYPRFVVIGSDGEVKARIGGEIPQDQWNEVVAFARSA